MKKVLCIVTCLLVISAFGAFAKETVKSESDAPQIHDMKLMTLEDGRFDSFGSLNASAAAETVFFGNWDFTSGPNCVDEGWTPTDFSEQIDDFWHVDDFAGLGGGSFGRLTPIEGTQSLWMGSRTKGLESLDLCGYATLPGYGNAWSQKWCTKTCLTVGSNVTVVFIAKWDSEPGYDGTTLQVATCTGGVSDDNWLATRTPLTVGGLWDGLNGGIFEPASVGPDSLITEVIADSMHTGSIRIRFLFEADGGWSDEDGLWDTDGAFLMDSLSVHDNGGNLLAVEDFEGETPGDIVSNDWTSCNEVGYSRGLDGGNYTNAFGDLFPALSLLQEDQCITEIGCVFAFINGSTDNYACGGFPGTTVVPFGPNARNQYIYEEIVSPIIPFATTSPEVQMAIYRYTDLPLDNLVFYTFGVRSYVAGCPTNWRDDNGVYFGSPKAWGTVIFRLGDKLQVGATDIQIKTGARDMCAVWCGVFGSGACHSHGPLLGQIWLFAVESVGPQMQWPFGGNFNDNFPEDGTLTGTVRIDAAVDIRPSGNAIIENGDSSTIVVNDPLFGLSGNAFPGGKAGMASVYYYIGVYHHNADGSVVDAGYTGDQMVDDPSRYPVLDSTTAPDGQEWFIIQADTSFTPSGGIVLDRFNLDLDDNRFVAGDELRYFIAAQSNDGPGSWTYFYDKRHATDLSAGFAPSSTPDINVAYANYMEMTCLPTGRDNVDILYVDAADGRRVQPYYDTAFDQLNVTVDRFDVSWSGSSAQGAFAPRVQDVFAQLIPVYRKIVWDSGDLASVTVGDGTGATGTGAMKADDWAIIFPFLEFHTNLPGLLLAGNGLGSEWFGQNGQAAVDVKSVYMNFGLSTNDHKSLVGMPVNPLAISQGGIFNHILGPDTVVAYGGCPVLRQLDVFTQTGASVTESAYLNDPSRVAILSQTTANQGGTTAQVVLTGFSLRFLRDDVPSGIADRVDYLFDVFTYMQNPVAVPTGTGDNPGLRNSLSQNYPNPFNPTTTIDYTLREGSLVKLSIYNVAGQLVKTLVNENRLVGAHTVKWDGRNNAGQTVSSGVYFYKLTSKSFVQTKKMVLLK